MNKTPFDQVIENLTLDRNFKTLRLDSFLNEMAPSGHLILRNIYQLFHDMIHFYAQEVKKELVFDAETIGFLNYNLDRIFIHSAEKPFFSDRLFSNRLVNLAKSFRTGGTRNKIYVFQGPAGSGKSTFLNNLLTRLEEYVRSDDGTVYEVVWHIPFERSIFDPANESRDKRGFIPKKLTAKGSNNAEENIFEVPCPNHDNPILMLPKGYREELLSKVIPEGEFKKKLFKHRQYNWVFQYDPCTICSSMFSALAERHPVRDIFNMIHARRHYFNRRQGIGISVFNSGDEHERILVRTNETIQAFLNEYFQDSQKVQYLFSGYSSTNHGIRALMDLKARNISRFLDLHGIISDEVHKVGDLEERIKSLFIVLMNPGDLDNIDEEYKEADSSIDLSLKDRIHEIHVPYVLDYQTEIKIYSNTFGEQIRLRFLPHVLENFARIVVSSRIKKESKTIKDWIEDEDDYEKFCDPDFLLLKMDLYAGILPDWLTKEDRGSLKAEVWKSLLAESEIEGQDGFSGRESNQIFDEFYSKHSKKRPISMRQLTDFFLDEKRDFRKKLPGNFIRHLTDLYDFEVLKEVKDSMYHFNEEEISKSILNYLVAITHNIGDLAKNPWLNQEEFTVTSDLLDIAEAHLLTPEVSLYAREKYRKEAIDEYASFTLGREIKVEGKHITKTKQYLEMFAAFTRTARERILEPYVSNPNFRLAIKEFGSDDFLKYDRKIRDRVELLFRNLKQKYKYEVDCARVACLYVLDNKLVEKFSEK